MKTRTPRGLVSQSAAEIDHSALTRTIQVIVQTDTTAIAIRDLIRGILAQQTPRFYFEWRLWHDVLEEGGWAVFLELPSARFEIVYQDLSKDLVALFGLDYVLMGI